MDIAISSATFNTPDSTVWSCIYWVDSTGNLDSLYCNHRAGMDIQGWYVPTHITRIHSAKGGIKAERVCASRTLASGNLAPADAAHILAYSTDDSVLHLELRKFDIDSSSFDLISSITEENLAAPALAVSNEEPNDVRVFAFANRNIYKDIYYARYKIDGNGEWDRILSPQPRFCFATNGDREYRYMSADLADGRLMLYLLSYDQTKLYYLWMYKFSVTNSPFELLIDNLLI